MNFLCHAIPYLDQPLMAMCTGVPDWLSVVDRKIRARRKMAEVHLDSDDNELQQVAHGIIRHIDDDHWFHGSEAFVTTNLELAVQLRDRLPGDSGFRPMFVGHIIIEMLLDAGWLRRDPSIGKRYYDSIIAQDANVIQRCVNTITGKPTEKLAGVVEKYAEIRFLFDYLDYDLLLMRLNQVMKRVGLSALPDELTGWLAETDKLVESRRQELLTPSDGGNPFKF
ncbi:hypothetical protein LF1_20220 [Rubripirellula obstinata]|uniref:Uncharacterized protein n=2 Tax=Rubripirellula obstinata TaxID=406547 RepID=A0A5B1CEA8_9BACT|nr:hypothetical protein LF1_20220 [Rubripirellula obstinata]